MEFSEESLREGAKIMKKIINGEPKNINPLKKMPKPEMRLYCINNNYFDTKKELEEYCKNNKISIKDMYTLDYIRNVAGRNDVICKTKANSKPILYKAVDEDGYGIYNYDRSVYRGEFI